MQDNQTPNPVPPPPAAQRPRRRSNWWIPLAVIGGLLVLIIVVIGAFVGALMSGIGEFDDQPKPLKSKTVLLVDLSSGVVEYRPPVVLNIGGDEAGIHLADAVSAIEDAAHDPKIEGILFRSGGSVGFTKLTEIRDAMVTFKESGKFVYAYMEGGGKGDYYLASVADSVFMPAEGLMVLNAFGATGVFLKDMTEKIGVEFHVEQFEEYKSAAEQVSRRGWSDPAKEAVRAIIAQREDMWVTAVAASRSMEAEQIRADLSAGVYIPDTLVDRGYVDGLAYEWAVRENIARRIDPDDTTAHPKLRVKSLKSYAKSKRGNLDQDYDIDLDRTFAIVYASGAIAPGSNNDPFDQTGIYSKDLIRDLRKAWKDDDVEAILLRVDSPGGSALASDEIWTTIQEIRKDKPIYASMSDVAASGGYYISMACDTIIAAPSTITGSIGVIMAIPNLSGTMGKIGVTTDTISMGPSSTFMNTLRPFEDADIEQLRAFGAGIYKRFVQKVADSRGMDFEEARALAKGRVWTGEDALKAGLIDMTGDFDEAIAAIKKRIGVDPDTKIGVKIYPEKVDNIVALLKMFGIDQDKDEDASGTTNTSVRDLVTKIAAPNSPVDQVLATLPPDARRQLEHAAAMTMIGLKEPTMMMLPMPVPEF